MGKIPVFMHKQELFPNPRLVALALINQRAELNSWFSLFC